MFGDGNQDGRLSSWLALYFLKDREVESVEFLVLDVAKDFGA